MVLLWRRHLLASPAFAKKKVPQHVPTLETPVVCCWGYSKAKQFLFD